MKATSEMATRAVLPTPPALAVKLFDWREPLYMKTLLGRDAGAAGHLDDGVAHLARRHRLIFVEQGLDQDRRQQR